jgi:hypothetical protein
MMSLPVDTSLPPPPPPVLRRTVPYLAIDQCAVPLSSHLSNPGFD